MLGIITVALPRSITSDGSLITPSDCSLLFGNKPNTITIVADGLSTSGRELRRALTAGELPCNVWRRRAYEREEKRTETSD